MDATSPMSADLQRQQDRKRKRKAILAGGVVLGLGAAVTLAAWSDDVFANGFFETGTFELEGSADNSTWTQYDTAPGAALFFETAASSAVNASSLQYDETVWAPLSVRLDADTDIGGDYLLNDVIFPNPTASTLAEDQVLDFVVYANVDHGTCTATADGDTPVGSQWTTGTVGAATASTTRALTPGATGVAGTPDNLCLGITLTSNAPKYMGQTATQVQWQFTATADE